MSTYQPLRPRQEQALAALRASIGSGCKRIVMQAPTGFGKTRLSAEIVSRAQDRGNRVIFTVPALTLVDQTVQMFYDQGIRDIGVMQANHEMTDPTRSVQVASVQTMMRRNFAVSDVVIIDEVHRWFAFYEDLLSREEMADVPVIGLSATPWTKGLGKWFEKLVVAGTVKDGIEEGWLSKYRAFAPIVPNLRGVRVKMGDYVTSDLSKVMDLAPLTGSIVDTWRLYGQGRPTFCFAVDRAHAKHLQSQFDEIGVSTGYVDAFTPREEREQIRRQFENDEIEIVFNVGVLTTGVDWDVRCIILARPTKSEMLYVQMIGRGLRTTPPGKEEKDHLLILDHTGTSLKLGLVDDIHHDELNDGTKPMSESKGKPTPLPKECPKCHFLKPPKIHVCPACGFKPTKHSKIEPATGSLVEITSRKNATEAFKRDWYAMFLGEAQRKGYKDGWVFHKYREAFREEPPHHYRSLRPKTPDEEMLSWLLSQKIRYFKSQKKRAA
jgi:superfamily II DNA or RNA helicase